MQTTLKDGTVLVDNSKEVLDALDDAISRALNAVGMQAEGHAKDRCPVATGRLRNSITHTISGAGQITQVYQDNNGKKFGTTLGAVHETRKMAYIGTNVEYAFYVETNDKMHHTNGYAHFLRDAATKHISEYRAILESYLMKG